MHGRKDFNRYEGIRMHNSDPKNHAPKKPQSITHEPLTTLVITVKPQQTIKIGDISIHISKSVGNVRLGIRAPRSVKIDRSGV